MNIPTNKEVEDKILTRVLKALPHGMADEIDAMGLEQLKRRVLDSQEAMLANKVAQLSDPDLLQAKDKVRELTVPYKEVDKAQQATASYALICIAQQGAPVEEEVNYGHDNV